MILKEKVTEQKIRGGYYTPLRLADFIVKQTYKKNIDILEPSCGDGVFIESLLKCYTHSEYKSIDAVEIVEEEAKKCKRMCKNALKVKIINDDFYNFYSSAEKKYDLIIGNPPYIRYQYLKEEQRKRQADILTKNGMKANKLINSWVFFLVACIEMLKENGQVAFIIPAELMQVAYAEDLRDFLSKTLSKILIISFDELVFDDAQQEVIALIGKKKSSKSKETKISNLSFKNIEDMEKKFKNDNIDFSDIISNEKWTRYYLSGNQNQLIERYNKDDNFLKLGDIAIVNVGVTTGNNDFFSITQDTVSEYDLKKYTLPLIGRSAQANSIVFDKNDWNLNVNKGSKAFLLAINDDVDYNNFNEKQLQYIKLGEENGENDGYKCKIRNRWYSIPSIWIPDAFLLRRSNIYPKFVLNSIDAISTDTMHRIKFNKGVNKNKAILSYYNSISFAYTELCGRSYGRRSVRNITYRSIEHFAT